MRIGIDLGGTKIEGIKLDAAGNTLARQRLPTPRGSYGAIVAAIVALIKELAAGEVCSIGIGTPGSLGTNGRLRNSNTTEMNGQPLQDDLQRALGQAVAISNDANCFTLSEAIDGAGTGFHSVFGVIIGTGTGGGLYLNGGLVVGSNHIGGEWGHNTLPWPADDERPGPRCYCGNYGCIETFCSGPGLSHHHQQRWGEQLSAIAIAEAADAGDPRARASLDDYENRLARALASVINIVDPQCIVLGGGLSNIKRLYQRVPECWGRYIFSDTINTQLRPPHHGDASGVRGAAWLGAELA